jgi:hypothetical protein
VAAWAELHLEPDEKADLGLPLFSKDIDLRGGKATMRFLANDLQLAGAELTGFATATRKNAPHMGKAHVAGMHWRGHRTSIEVLERLPGLDESIAAPENGTRLLVQSGLPLLDPCSLFICKLHAANTRPVEHVSNDITHLRILARVIPRFLARIRAAAMPDYDAKEDAARLLKQIEACQSGLHPFEIPLGIVHLSSLMSALRSHLKLR